VHLNGYRSEHFQNNPVELIMAVVETELSLLQMQIKRMPGHAVELRQPPFGKAPETLDAVHVTLAAGEFTLIVIDPQMPGISDIDQTVIAAPAIGMDDTVDAHMASNGPQKRAFAAVRHDLGINVPVAFEDAKDDGLAAGATAAFTANSTRSEVTFIDFHLAGKRAGQLTLGGNVSSEFQVNVVDRTDTEANQLCRVTGGQIHRKVAQQTTKHRLADSCLAVISISSRSHRSQRILTGAPAS
jgi:hypothetical protein